MPLALGSPAAAVVLFLCVPVVWLAYHSYRRLSDARRAVTTTLRVLGLVLLGLALSGFRVQRPTDALATVFLLDDSASLSADAQRAAAAFVRNAVRAAQPGDRFALAAFGREPVVASGWNRETDLGPLRVTTDRSATNIAQALDVGLAMLPDDRAGRLVVVSDGHQTHGDAAGMAGLVRWQSASVDAVLLRPGGDPDPAVVAVDVPAVVEPGARVPVRVELRSNAVTPVVLRLFRNEAFWIEEQLTLIRGVTPRVYEDTAAREGAAVYRADLEAAQDAVPENNRGLGLTRVASPPQVWVVDGDGSGLEVRALLQAGGLAATAVAADALPETVAGYAAARAVILANVPAVALVEGQQRALAAAVREFGVGLVMLGNTQSFGPGGWRGTPVEEVLPVIMESTRVREGTVGIVLVLDVSGSMQLEAEGLPRLQFARDAALSAYAAAEAETLVGLVTFGDDAKTVLPLKRRPNDVGGLVPTLQGLRAGGATFVAPALRKAIELLTQSEATTRHILFMTDGAFTDPLAVAPLYPALKAANITLSAIGAGPGVDETQLRELAEATEGIFYPYTRAAALPAVFARDTLQVVRNPVVRGPIVPVPRAPGAPVRGIAWSSAPLLDAMISTTLRDAAQLYVSSPDQDPLVASWRVGLATTAVLCTDWGGAFTPAWRTWPERSTLLDSLVRATLPPLAPAMFQAALRLQGDEAVLTADAVNWDGTFVNGLDLEATLVSPEGQARTTLLRQVGPGQYAGRTPVAGVGMFSALVRDRSSRAGGRQWLSAARAYPAEFAPASGEGDLLAVLAEETGGRVLTEPSQAFRRPPAPRTVRTDLWQWLTGIALCLFPVDIAARRFLGRPQAPVSVPGMGGAPATSARVAPRPRPADAVAADAARPAPGPPVAEPRAPAASPSASGTAPAEPPAPPPEAGPASTTSRLLDAKRKAREERGDDAH